MTRLSHILAVSSLAVLAGSARGQPYPFETELRFQARHFDQTHNLGWAGSVTAMPGDRIEVRAVVSYTGTSTVYGLGQIVFQPMISDWSVNDAVIGTPGTPNNEGIGPLGSNTSIPPGYVYDLPGLYGRIIPWAGSNTTTSSYYKGHVHVNPDGTGRTYLRIARSDVTNWVGLGPTAGSGALNNTNGAGGVYIGQGTIGDGRPTHFPPQNNDITDVVVFKFSFVLGAEPGMRDLRIYPGAHYPGGPLPEPPPNPWLEARWYSEPDQTFPGQYPSSFTGVDAFVHVIPTPASVVLVVCAPVLRRRRPAL